MSHRLPRISIVTPSLNQAAFLEQTIQSVLEQGYPDLQYGIVDGGSTDGSIDIIERYRDRLDFVIIEPDSGQPEAINKGFRKADGQIINWLCSDDTLLPGSLHRVGEFFASQPDAVWMIGRAVDTDAAGERLQVNAPRGVFSFPAALFREGGFNVPQPATFWRRSLLDECGLLNETLQYCQDYELWLRFLEKGHQPVLVESELATYRMHPASKSCSQADRFIATLIRIGQMYAPHLRLRDRLALMRLLGYQKRALAVRQAQQPADLWPVVMKRPWWLASQQIRARLRRGMSTVA